MKRIGLTLGVLLLLSMPAAAEDRQKQFTILVVPPDAGITVISGSALSRNGLKEQVYRSPAMIKAMVPGDPELIKKAVVKITRDRFKPKILPLETINDGDVLKVDLEKEFRLRFRMIRPRQSNDILIRDRQVLFGLRVDEENLQMSLTNNTAAVIRILWQRASYTDVHNRTHRIMHAGIPFENRFNSFPFQDVMPFVTLHQVLIPVQNVVLNPQRKEFEVLPMFPEAGKDLSGKEFKVHIPVEIDGRVVPYSFGVKVDVI